MDDIEKIKQKIRNKQNKILPNSTQELKKNKLSNFLSKVLLSTIMFLMISITIKISPESKETIYKNVFENNFSFAYINKMYNKYFGEVLPVNGIFKEETKAVFKEELTYENKEKYLDGVNLTVTENYLIPILESGMVVFVGKKEGYGNCIIIQQVNGIDTWYGNISTNNVKLYDYVEKGELLGETSKNLYLVFKKDGEVLDYNEYIK